MQDRSIAVKVGAARAAAPAIALPSERRGVIRPFLNAVSAVGAVTFLMSCGDLGTPVPYLCGAAALLAALGADLAG